MSPKAPRSDASNKKPIVRTEKIAHTRVSRQFRRWSAMTPPRIATAWDQIEMSPQTWANAINSGELFVKFAYSATEGKFTAL